MVLNTVKEVGVWRGLSACCMFVMLLSDTSSRTWPENAHMTNATALPSSCCPGLFWTDCKHTVASRGENYGGIDCEKNF